jgi:hypothetical protein
MRSAFEDIFKEIDAPTGLYTNLFLSSKKIQIIENPKLKVLVLGR